jgi:cytochrome P450
MNTLPLTGGAGGEFGLPPEFRTNPYPFYHQLRSLDRVLWMPGMLGRGAYLVSGHQECSAVLKDNRFGKEAHKVLPPEEVAKTRLLSAQTGPKSMLMSDPPTHTRLRGLVNQAFTPRVLERLRPHIEEIADQLIDEMAGQKQVDLIEAFAFPLPIVVIAELLGVPAKDRTQFKVWSNPIAALTDPTATPQMMADAMNVMPELSDYLSQIIAERRREPRQDLITALTQAHDQGDKLSADELLITCRLLLIAGHETTVNLIGNGMLALLRHPEQKEWLAAHPEGTPAAIEELLRYDSPVQLTNRIAFEDVTVGSHTIEKGQQVVTLLGAANRDPEMYAEPDRLDLTRKNAGTHLSFAQGIHYCLGAPLARMEGQIAISALLRRLPQMTLVPGELQYRGNITLRGLKALPVNLG